MSKATTKLPLSKLLMPNSEGIHERISLPSRATVEVLTVRSPFLLIQASGYLKYVLGQNKLKSVYFRGQTTLYDKLQPSLYRGVTKPEQKSKRDSFIEEFLSKVEADKKTTTAVPGYAREALFQHYGLKTRWLDVVDNVWVALWFACHNARATGRYGEFLHFERRDYEDASDQYAYILLVQTAPTTFAENMPGYGKDDRSETIDLRVACPSQFIRPHAQHGLLVRGWSSRGQVLMDCSSLIAGIIRIELRRALQWLGEGRMLCAHGLFPPPVYDFGYRELLDSTDWPDQLGRISHIGTSPD